MNKEIAIEVKNLNKSFRLPIEQASGIKQAVINRAKGIKGYKTQHVLRNISFNVEKGDFFGIVGRNGSGKSTLLKLISNIYEPDSGSIKINGSLVSFIELGVGFNPELTGRENVYLNGAMLGFDTKEIDEMYDEIVEFAELEEFMDQKLKNYSSGMQVRLAFSCAIRAKSDILVLDEVLAVGDEAFQKKCYQYFATLKKKKKTVILVTHSMDSVQQFCTKAIMIEEGKISIKGNSAKVAQKYRELNDMRNNSKLQNNTDTKDQFAQVKTNIKQASDKISFDIELIPKSRMEDAAVIFYITRDTGEKVYRFSSQEKNINIAPLEKGNPMKFHLEIENIFCNGVFNLGVFVKKRDRTVNYISIDNASEFEIYHKERSGQDIYWKPKESYEVS